MFVTQIVRQRSRSLIKTLQHDQLCSEDIHRLKLAWQYGATTRAAMFLDDDPKSRDRSFCSSQSDHWAETIMRQSKFRKSTTNRSIIPLLAQSRKREDSHRHYYNIWGFHRVLRRQQNPAVINAAIVVGIRRTTDSEMPFEQVIL